MPNLIDASGLQTKTREELVLEFTEKYKDIYGEDINLDQDSPDGQMMMIYIQSILDVLDLIKMTYDSFDPDTAIGVSLDRRVSYNGIQRLGGTYSRTMISIVASRPLNLYGKNQSIEPVYTVQDDAGNQWELLETQSILSIGTYSYLFQAKEVGAKITIPNTIIKPSVIVLGVESVNNPNIQTVVGVNEETDQELKIRRQKAIGLASEGFFNSLISTIMNIDGVSYVNVYENSSDAIDTDGVPAHSVWVIVSGNPSDEEVATAIYKKKSAGCGMHGEESFQVTRPDGALFEIKWDKVETLPLFVKMNVESLDEGVPVNYELIKETLPETMTPAPYERINVNDLVTEVKKIDPNTLVTYSGFSELSSGTYTSTIIPLSKKVQHVIMPTTVILLPILVQPSRQFVSVSEEVTFEIIGGYELPSYSYLIHVNNSGASIVGGVYTAGTTPSIDTIRIQDSLGNFTDVLITVEA